MKTDINLIQKNKISGNGLARITLFTGIVFFIVFLIAVGVILYALFLKSQLTAIDAQQLSVKNQIAGFATTRDNLVLINERLVNIKKVLATRQNLDSTVGKVMATIPQTFGVESMTADDEVISLTLSSDKLSDFDDLMEAKLPLLTKDKTLGVKRLDVGGFTQVGTGYQLDLDFYFTLAKKER